MSEFTSEWKETKVVMSVEEFDRYRAIETSLKERKIYRFWDDDGGYGKTIAFSVVEESDVINELIKKIDELNSKNAHLRVKLQEVKLNDKKTEKSNAWWK